MKILKISCHKWIQIFILQEERSNMDERERVKGIKREIYGGNYGAVSLS